MQREIFIKQLRDLVGFKTVTNYDFINQPWNTEFDKAFKYIIDQMNPRTNIRIIENQVHGEVGKAKVLLLSNTETLNPDFLYLVHIDVVEVQDQNQFNLTEEGEYLYGRGAADMKFSIPIGIHLLNGLIEQNSDTSFCMAITTDEETGGFRSAKYLADTHGQRAKCLIVPDGGGNFRFVYKNKGVCEAKVVSSGKSAHSSRPWLGRSAIDPMVDLAAKLAKKYKLKSSDPTQDTTLNIGSIRGGVAQFNDSGLIESIATNVYNVVPNGAEMLLNFRFNPETDSYESLIKMLVALSKKYEGIEIMPGAYGEPVLINMSDPTVVRFLATMQKYLARKPEIFSSFGSHDGRHFTKYGIPMIMTQGKNENEHQIDERLHIDSTLLLYKIFWEFVSGK